MSEYNFLRQQRDSHPSSSPRGYRTHLTLTLEVAVKDGLIGEALKQDCSVSTLCSKILKEWLDVH